MVTIGNELRDAERIKKELVEDVKTMKRGIKHQEKFLQQIMGDAGFEEKIEDLKAQIEEVKQQYKQEMKDHKTTEGPLKESHLRLSMLEEEHQRCK